MVFLTVAVIVVGALCLLNLLLTFGVIRRLRAHTERLEILGAQGVRTSELIPVPGYEVPEVAAATVDGEPVSFAERTLVAFFAQGCSACEDKLPEFVSHAGAVPGGRDRVLAVVSGEPGRMAATIDALAAVARVVTGPQADPVIAAFGVRAFPTFGVVEGGTVRAIDNDLARLPEPSRA
ncbi:hypothetical protein SAMN05444920_1011082 [Nonomuraea solani]|uniref:Thioredoxin domain-containing protein n=1 Tax=Nonomuraea solani TaxID=1144553 RepID=A0A1H5W4Y2_9ACTN|nr:hypothetical protein [Nonomuraea solani]SEF94552.1 hypothetical protein SAMN05444920_1011082 [Nonomuraea solani]